MKSKLGTILMIGGVVLIIAAIGLLTYNKLDEKRAAESVGTVAREVRKQIPEAAPGDEDVVEAEEKGIGNLGTVEADGTAYVGILEVPSLNLELPVISEWSYPALKIAPCLYNLDIENNSLVIAAHNYASHFGSLNILTGGEEVVFTDVDGNEYRYVVSEVVITQPTDIEGMLDNSWDLTLFTCNYGGSARVTVRCRMT